MFMKLEDGRVYCLPDGYEVIDRSLDIIRFVLNPTFPPQEVSCPCIGKDLLGTGNSETL